MTTIDREHLRAEAQACMGPLPLTAYLAGKDWDETCSPEVALALLDALDAAEAQVQQVRDLHHPWGDTLSGKYICDACDSHYPCPTIRALDSTE